jgi:hypothetical protein
VLEGGSLLLPEDPPVGEGPTGNAFSQALNMKIQTIGNTNNDCLNIFILRKGF